MSIDQLTEFLGWASVINLAMLFLAAGMLVFMRDSIAAIHSRFFDLDDSELNKVYFQYLAQYKIAIIMLNIVPYFALKIMA